MKKFFVYTLIVFFSTTSITNAYSITRDLEQIKKRTIIVKKKTKIVVPDNVKFYADIDNIEKCKIKDLTVNKNFQLISSGFERFTFEKFKDKNSISLLVLPVSFKDLLFTDNDFLNLIEQMDIVQKFFYFNSYGKSKINYTVANKKYWVELPKLMDEYGLSPNGKKVSQDILVQEIFYNTKKELSLGSYDIVAIQTNNKTNYYFAGGLLKNKGQEFVSPSGKVHSVILDGGSTSGNWITIAHELGHAWLGFEDLYNHFDFSNSMKNWDLMANAYNSELLGWHRWSAGWIEDKNVVCLKNSSNSFIKLSSLNSIGENKLIAIPVSDGKSFFIEYRTKSEYYSGKNIVIGYFVDTSIWHGYSPYKLIKEFDSNNDSVVFDNIKISVTNFTNNEVYVKIS